MKWKVENALNRDVERQHLNKILKEIEARVSSSESSQGLTEQQVRDIVRSSLPPAPRPPSFLLSLDGDVAGTALLAGQDVTMDVELQVPVVEEAPSTGFSYWRTFGEWTQVPNSLLALAINEDPGFLVNNPSEGTTVSRLFEAVMGELVVVNPDGIDGNVLYGLADVVPTSGGTIKTVEFDSKGRRISEDEADTDDLPEGSTNLYYEDGRVYEKVKEILVAGTNIVLTEDDVAETISLAASGGGGGGGGIDGVVAGAGISVDNTVPELPVVSLSTTTQTALANAIKTTDTPTDGDIVEYNGTLSAWKVTKGPRLIYLDGGNF